MFSGQVSASDVSKKAKLSLTVSNLSSFDSLDLCRLHFELRGKPIALILQCLVFFVGLL